MQQRRGNIDLAVCAYRVSRIDAQIEQDLVQMGRMNVCLQVCCFYVEMHIDCFGYGGAQRRTG